MNILIVVCNPHENSFNHAIAEKVRAVYEREGNNVYYHDLYKEKFNPLLYQDEIDSRTTEGIDNTIQDACRELLDSDLIVMIHPNWWGMPPAMMKGWIDRVFRRGVAYRFDPFGRSVGLLEGKKGIVFNTSNTPEEVEMRLYGDPLGNLWEKCIFEMCGIKDVKRRNFFGVVRSSEDEREAWLNIVNDMLIEEEEI